MPAHICHLIFGEEALVKALGRDGETILDQDGNLFRFACQGPDFFYHNQRTKPTGLKYGVAIHREGYGRLVRHMIDETFRLGNPLYCSLNAFILGFITHAFLDRATHPFINYFSGWVDTEDRETEKYYRCHVYLERIIDVMILKIRRGLDIKEYSFLPLVDCGENLPYQVIKTLLKSLNAGYPQMRYKSRDRRRIENAYKDTIFFYKVTDPLHSGYRRLAYARDRKSGYKHRRLALFHPLNLPPGIDFLNLKKMEWVHPGRSDLKSNSSFPDLYEKALAGTVSVLRGIRNILKNKEGPGTLEQYVGNESLDTGLSSKEPALLRFSSPLPLPELIDELYTHFDLS